MLRISSYAELKGLPGFGTADRIQRGLANTADAGLRAPLFIEKDTGTILDDWNALLEVGRLPSRLMELERSEAKKVGPYYRTPFSEWKVNLEGYFQYDPEPFSLAADKDPEIEAAFADYVKSLRKHIRNKLVPLPPELTLSRAKRNTNLGFPAVTSNWEQGNLGYYLRRAKDMYAGKRTTLYPFILFRRVTPGGPKVENAKQRPVWGADHAESFCNLGILYVINDALRSHIEWADLQGIDFLESVLSPLLERYPYKLSLDLSRADATVSPRMLRLGLRVVNELVELPVVLLEQTYEYYTSGRIMTPTGLWSGVHGLPSGVAWTNLLERFIFSIVALVAAKQQGKEIGNLFQNGDDGLYLTSKELDADKFASTFKDYGFDMNVSKSHNESDYCSYLQRHFYRELGWSAIMSTNRMLGRIVFSESGGMIDDYLSAGFRVREYWTLNTIQKLENCKRHPHFVFFVNYVKSGDKFGLDVAALTAQERAVPLDYVTLGQKPDVDSLKTSGLMNFETVKVLTASSGQRSSRTVEDTALEDHID